VNSAVPIPETNVPAKSFWRRRVVDVVAGQLKQGITPQKISLTIALGVTLGLFPILGSTTLLCFLAALCFKLNQPIIQAVNYLIYPLQIMLILVFVRIGEWLMHAPRVSFSIPELLRKFHESPVKFMHEFGLTGLHAIIAWLLIAPLLIALLYWPLLLPLKKLARKSGAKKS
jgi:uncharacterized protein (DUF2062 family)